MPIGCLQPLQCQGTWHAGEGSFWHRCRPGQASAHGASIHQGRSSHRPRKGGAWTWRYHARGRRAPQTPPVQTRPPGMQHTQQPDGRLLERHPSQGHSKRKRKASRQILRVMMHRMMATPVSLELEGRWPPSQYYLLPSTTPLKDSLSDHVGLVV